MNKIFSIIIFSVFLSVNSWAQIYPHDYPEYDFINHHKNKLELSETSNFNGFLEALNDLFINGERTINIVHFGGSHIQADVWSHRIRQHFFNLIPQNSGGRGLVFPYRIIKTNGSPYVKFKSEGVWKGYRNSLLKHKSEFGLTGITAKTKDSITSIQLNINKKKCQTCSFNSLKVIHNQTTHCITVDDPDLVSINHDSSGTTTFFFQELKDSIQININKEDTIDEEFALYGIVIENDLPGIKYHSIGVNGASVPSYLRSNSFTDELQHLKPDLAILSIGINDAYETTFSKEKFINNYDSLIQKILIANPTVSILFTTNNDSYYKRKYPNKNAFLVREAMEELSEKYNGVVWDMFGIMGGIDSIKKWEENGLAKSDKIHFTVKGYKLIGDLLFEAIINSYSEYIRKHI
ncbi:MAG: GDSL-type esterase/lipase family protein [Flavobacteriales bacterium]|nr:GDSL-type esterase/lipase family protein [Flavobacteriales bacterium]